MNLLLIGNILSFAGAILMVCIGLIKTKRNILLAQNGQFILMGIGNLVLGGVSGALSNGLGIIRNLVCLNRDFTPALKALFIALQAVLTLILNREGLFGWLPFVAALLFTLSLDAENAIVLKLAIIAGQLCWCFYDASIRNYTALAFDIFTVLSNIVGILRIRHGGAAQSPEETAG